MAKQLQIHTTLGRRFHQPFKTFSCSISFARSRSHLIAKMESTKEMSSMHPLDVSFDDDSSSDEQYHTHHSIQFENDQYEDQGGQKRSIKKWTEEEVSDLTSLH